VEKKKYTLNNGNMEKRSKGQKIYNTEQVLAGENKINKI